jgi:hypothetical protein
MPITGGTKGCVQLYRARLPYSIIATSTFESRLERVLARTAEGIECVSVGHAAIEKALARIENGDNTRAVLRPCGGEATQPWCT